MKKPEKIFIRGSFVDLAEEHKHYLTLTNCICYFDYPNANKRIMEYGETEEQREATLQRVQSLRLMPVYAKCAKNRKGEPTFKGHEVTQKVTKDGIELEFDTIPIGVHESVYIEERDIVAADGTAQHLWCLMAKQRIWKRNKKAIAAIKRLFDERKLYNSWEMETTQYRYKDGIKYLDDYEFLGNCFLGPEYATPAFGKASQVLEVATGEQDDLSNYELMIAEALFEDLAERNESEVNLDTMEEELSTNEISVDKNKNKKKLDDLHKIETPSTPTVEEEEEEEADSGATGGEQDSNQTGGDSSTSEEITDGETSADNENTESSSVSAELSALTDRDIRQKLEVALNRDKYVGYICYIFPTESEAWVHKYDDDELNYTSVKYEIIDDAITIVSQTPIKLISTIREMNKEISSRDDRISELEKSVQELSEYKEKFESAEKIKKDEEKKKKRAACATMVRKSKLFSEKEISASPIKELIDTADEAKIKIFIADKMLGNESFVETSEADDEQLPVVNLNANETTNYASTFMKAVRG